MPRVTRRILVAGSLLAAGGATIMSKPNDASGPRDAYFLSVQQALIDAGIATPTLVIDRSRLNQNIDTLISHLPEGMGYRIVAKSLPSLELIKHIADRSGTDRLMTFNQPMLSQLSIEMPNAKQLLGKPLPVRAAETYFETLPNSIVSSSDKIQWLIDTPARLDQYAKLAEKVGKSLAINIEIDVGLHRGGFKPGTELRLALERIRASNQLSFAGFMGYEPHLPALPEALGWRERAKQGAWNTYREALALAGETFSDNVMNGLTRNAAGSPTYRYYQDTSIANEISAGSCLVKPTHFDSELLEPHVPASFIATPVIKSFDRTQLPGLEFAEGVSRAWDPNAQNTIFIYGGNWMADPIDPPGLSYNKTFGRSSNQEMLNGGKEIELVADDFVFFRPHQSEAVFLQFGDIAVFEDGAIVKRWPVFPASS